MIELMDGRKLYQGETVAYEWTDKSYTAVFVNNFGRRGFTDYAEYEQLSGTQLPGPVYDIRVDAPELALYGRLLQVETEFCKTILKFRQAMLPALHDTVIHIGKEWKVIGVKPQYAGVTLENTISKSREEVSFTYGFPHNLVVDNPLAKISGRVACLDCSHVLDHAEELIPAKRYRWVHLSASFSRPMCDRCIDRYGEEENLFDPSMIPEKVQGPFDYGGPIPCVKLIDKSTNFLQYVKYGFKEEQAARKHENRSSIARRRQGVR